MDCRRILKWTYAYGYYRFAESAQAQTSAQASAAAEALKQQQEFFEFNQVRSHTLDTRTFPCWHTLLKHHASF